MLSCRRWVINSEPRPATFRGSRVLLAVHSGEVSSLCLCGRAPGRQPAGREAVPTQQQQQLPGTLRKMPCPQHCGRRCLAGSLARCPSLPMHGAVSSRSTSPRSRPTYLGPAAGGPDRCLGPGVFSRAATQTGGAARGPAGRTRIQISRNDGARESPPLLCPAVLTLLHFLACVVGVPWVPRQGGRR